MVKVRIKNKPNGNIQSLSSNGTVFSNGLEFVNEGGTHEMNPNQGIQVSNDNYGTPNLVEEGEVIWNGEYVFSNRLKVPKEFKEKFKLGNPKKDESYAELVRAIQSKKEELANDPMAQRTLTANLTRLQESQEEERAKKEARDFKREISKLSPQEQQAVLSQMVNSQQEPETPLAPMPVQPYTPGEVVDDIPQGGVAQPQEIQSVPNEMNGLQGYAYGGNMFDNGGDTYYKYSSDFVPSPIERGVNNNKYKSYDWRTFLINNYGRLARAGVIDDSDFNDFWEYADAYKDEKGNTLYKTQKATEALKNISNDKLESFRDQYLKYKNNELQSLFKDPNRKAEQIRIAKDWYNNTDNTYKKNINLADANGNIKDEDKLLDHYLKEGIQFDNKDYTKEGELAYQKATGKLGRFAAAHYVLPFDDTPLKGIDAGFKVDPPQIPAKPIIPKKPKTPPVAPPDKPDDSEIPGLPTWMRYAPIWGSAFATAMSSAKPDYSRAEEIRRAYNYAPSLVQPRPIGDYMQYNPFDVNYQANQMAAQSAATRNAIMQQSSGNRGSAMAGLVALDNSTNAQLGNLYRQALDYNDNKRRMVSDFNRGTNQYNSQNNMQAQMANQGAINQAKMANAHGVQTANTMKEQIDAQRAAAISQNLTGLFNNIGNLGRENFAFNQINSNKAYNYGYKDKSGKTKYLVGLAYGGYLNR